MTPSSFRRATLALATALLSLSGCGGSGDDSPTSASTDYLRVGVVSDDASAGKTLVVFDADAPTTPRLSLRLSDTDSFEVVSDGQINVAAQSFTRTPDVAAYVVKGRQLFRVSLKKSDTTAAQRVSSLTTACSVADTFLFLNEAGWLTVTEAGPDLDCTTTLDNRIAYVRPTAAATTAPVYLPNGVRLLTELPDPTFTQIQHFLAVDANGTGKLTLYRDDLSASSDVTGGAGVSFVAPLIGPLTPGSFLVQAGNQLKTLTWTSTGATLASQSAYTVTTTPVISGWSDASAIYFADGLTIQRLPRGGTVQTLATLSAAQGSQAEVSHVTIDRVLIAQTDGTGVRTVYALPKTGGTPVTLVSNANAYVLGATASTLYYAIYTSRLVGSVLQGHSTVHSVNLDGTQRTTISTDAEGFPDMLFDRVYSYTSGLNLGGLVWCEPGVGSDGHCANGTLKMLNTTTGVATTLGNFSHTGTYSRWSAFDYDNLYNFLTIDEPLVLLTRGTRSPGTVAENELYIARPGVAGSLTKVNATP